MLASLILTFLLAASTLSLVLAVAMLMRGARLRSARRLLHLKVSARRDHGNGLFTLILRRPWPRRFLPLPKYVAGQSLAVSLPQGRLRRRYSLARWQARPFRYEITVKREDEGRLSHQLAENARRGSWLNVAPPSGDFVLPGDSAMSRAVLIAGGVGITRQTGQSKGFGVCHDGHHFIKTQALRNEGLRVVPGTLEKHTRIARPKIIIWISVASESVSEKN